MIFPPPSVPAPRPPRFRQGGLLGWVRGWWKHKPQRAFLMGISLLVLFYSGAVICQIIWTGDIGARCFFGTKLKEEVPEAFEWKPDRPDPGDRLLEIDGRSIVYYTDYIQAL